MRPPDGQRMLFFNSFYLLLFVFCPAQIIKVLCAITSHQNSETNVELVFKINGQVNDRKELATVKTLTIIPKSNNIGMMAFSATIVPRDTDAACC